MTDVEITKAGRIALLAIASSNREGRTHVAKGPALLKLERDGLILRDDSDGWWWLTAKGRNVPDVVSAEVAANYSSPVDPATVEITPVDMGDGVTVFYGTAPNGYSTGFYAEPNDARDVAVGQGTVSRPLWKSEVVLAPSDVVDTLMSRIRDLNVANVLGVKVGDIVTNGRTASPVVEVTKGMAWIQQGNTWQGFDVEHPAEWRVAESADDMPAPFRTASKVKNTRAMRRRRNG
jgi:hypothetical protein